ncbi:MAG: hypothetical protein ACI4SU_09415 [Anaerovoracaceae bacterium]
MKNGDRKVGNSSGRKLMDLVEDRYIEEAAELGEVSNHIANRDRRKQFRSKRRKGITAAAAAACLCLVLVGGLLGGDLLGGETMSGTEGDPQQGGAADLQQSGAADLQQSGAADPGWWIPAIQLPEPEEGVTYDMVACVVYKGNVYVGNTNGYYGEDADRIRGLLDEYVGEAKGNLDEWSTQSDYAEELAGSVGGSIYTLKGYDPDFRLACVGEGDILILEHLNGIHVYKGSEIFDDRLHLAENGKAVSCIDHETWYYGGSGEDDPVPVSIDEGVWNDFLKEISEGTFDDLQLSEVYGEIAVHLYVTMEDGTVNPFRISRDGYVLYDGLPWYGVKISDDTLQAVLEACGV